MNKNTTGHIIHTRPLTADELLNIRDEDIAYDSDNPPTTAAFWEGAVMKVGDRVIGTTRTRGPQKAPRKVATSIRLSQEVVEYFKATGTGWQTKLDEALREYVHSHPMQ